MSSFKIILQDSVHIEEFDRVSSFIAEDASGQFGLLAHHERFMTVLLIGLARFYSPDHDWKYIAVPGAVLYFYNNVLTLSSRRFLVDSDYSRITALLKVQLLEEEKELHSIRTSLREMEKTMLRLMSELE